MLKKVFLGLVLLMPVSAQAIVPFTVQDINIYENFLALEAAIKAQAKAQSTLPSAAPVDYLLFRDNTTYYKVSIESPGYLKVIPTATVNTNDYLWLPVNGTGVLKMSVKASVLDLQYIPIYFNASNMLFIAESTTDIWLLTGANNYFNLTYLGAL